MVDKKSIVDFAEGAAIGLGVDYLYEIVKGPGYGFRVVQLWKGGTSSGVQTCETWLGADDLIEMIGLGVGFYYFKQTGKAVGAVTGIIAAKVAEILCARVVPMFSGPPSHGVSAGVMPTGPVYSSAFYGGKWT